MPIAKVDERKAWRQGGGRPLLLRFYTGAKMGHDKNGKPKKKQNSPGDPLGYFRVEVTEQYAGNEALVQLAAQLTEEKITALPITFVDTSADKVFPHWHIEYGKSGLKRKCDGIHQTLWLDPETLLMNHKRIDCILNAEKPCKCMPDGKLAFTLPQMVEAGIWGFCRLTTHGMNSITDLALFVEGVGLDVEQDGKTLRNFPAILNVGMQPRTTVYENKQGTTVRSKQDKQALWLEADVLRDYQSPVRLPENDVRKLLGTGSKPRIMGRDDDGYEMAMEMDYDLAGEIPESPVEDHWAADNQVFDKFLAFIRDTFDYNKDGVYRALQALQAWSGVHGKPTYGDDVQGILVAWGYTKGDAIALVLFDDAITSVGVENADQYIEEFQASGITPTVIGLARSFLSQWIKLQPDGDFGD